MNSREKRASRQLTLSDFTLHAKGRWESRINQAVEIEVRDEYLGRLQVGPARWGVLAALINAKLDSQATGPDNAYMTKEEIADVLKALNSPFAFASYVKNYLHGLRHDLDAFLRRHLAQDPGPGGWGRLLIPSDTLGWHIAVPAKNLKLTILHEIVPIGSARNRADRAVMTDDSGSPRYDRRTTAWESTEKIGGP